MKNAEKIEKYKIAYKAFHGKEPEVVVKRGGWVRVNDTSTFRISEIPSLTTWFRNAAKKSKERSSFRMKAYIINEHGIEEAKKFLVLTTEKLTERSNDDEIFEYGCKNEEFLKRITVTLSIDAPMSWWFQFGKYVGGDIFVDKYPLQITRERLVRDVDPNYLTVLNALLLNSKNHDLIPLGLLKKCIVCTTYFTLRKIIKDYNWKNQKEWDYFIEVINKEIQYPLLLTDLLE